MLGGCPSFLPLEAGARQQINPTSMLLCTASKPQNSQERSTQPILLSKRGLRCVAEEAKPVKNEVKIHGGPSGCHTAAILVPA